jgi:hypothetical protein
MTTTPYRLAVHDGLAKLAADVGAHVSDEVIEQLTHTVADALAGYRTRADEQLSRFTLERVVQLLAARHPEVGAWIENTGGGVMCIAAAPLDEHGNVALAAAEAGAHREAPILAGAGSRSGLDGYCYADLADFSVGWNENLDWQPPARARLLAGDWFPDPATASPDTVAAAIAARVHEYVALRRADGPDPVRSLL